MKWESPEPGVYEASTTRTTEVILEVFDPQDGEEGEYHWWALSEGRVLGAGLSDSLESAMAQCELAAA